MIIVLMSDDFRWHDWRAFLDDMKAHIAAEEWEYNGEEKQWYVKATKQNVSILEQLRGRYFNNCDEIIGEYHEKLSGKIL